MKALEIFISCSLWAEDDCRRSALGGGAVYLDASAGLQPILTGRDDLFAGCHAIIDDRNALADLADFERPSIDSTVGLEDVGVISVLPALQRTRRHGHYIWRSAREKSDVQIFARPERAILIWESAFNTQRAGGLSNLVVEDCDRAFSQLLVVIAVHREDADRTGLQCRLDGGELTFGQGEDDGNRLELGDDDEAGRIGRMHDVALIDQSNAGPAGQWGGNRRVVELGFRAVDSRLIAADLRLELGYRSTLRVDLLFWGETARRQIAKSLQVEFCVGEIGFVLHLCCCRLIIRGLKGPRIDLRQEIARLDVLTFGESDLCQLAIDPRLDGDRVECL